MIESNLDPPLSRNFFYWYSSERVVPYVPIGAKDPLDRKDHPQPLETFCLNYAQSARLNKNYGAAIAALEQALFDNPQSYHSFEQLKITYAEAVTDIVNSGNSKIDANLIKQALAFSPDLCTGLPIYLVYDDET